VVLARASSKKSRRPRVVILGGAGRIGRITVQDLARTAGDLELVVADRELGPARGLPAELVEVDVTDPPSLASVLEGAFATIVSLPYRFNLAVMRGALDARVHYIDLGGLFHQTRKQLRLDAAFRRRGLTALLGMGSAPGIIDVLAVHAAEGMEAVHEVHCQVASVDKTRWRIRPPPIDFGYSPDTLLDEFLLPAAVYRRGKFEFVPALDPRARITARFPAPVGEVVLDTTLHSEVAMIPRAFHGRGLEQVTFRQGFDQRFVDRLKLLVELGLVDTAPLAGTGFTPRQLLLGLLGRFPAPVARGKPWKYEILRALVRGARGGRPVTIAADCHAGPKGGGGVGPDIDTGAPPSIAVQMLLSGQIGKRGVVTPEEAVPVGPLIRALTRRGMKVRRHALPDSGA
jgi:saccharopine dehydrogenase-like NADP-dependent oxidoreductase